MMGKVQSEIEIMAYRGSGAIIPLML